jgi:undecaprenyl-diphosphatase
MGPVVWRWPLAVMIALVALAMVALDTIVAANRLPADSALLRYALAWTDVGKTYTILVPTLILLIGSSLVDWGRLKPRARLLWLQWTALSAYLLVSVMLTELILTLVKYAIGRARPSLFSELGAFHFDPLMFHFRYASFPSGHSGTAGSAAMGLALLFPRLRFPLLVLALWLTATRIFVVAHYPSDAIAGLMIGAWIAYVMALVFAKHGLLFETSGGWLPRPRRTFHLLPRSLRRPSPAA